MMYAAIAIGAILIWMVVLAGSGDPLPPEEDER